MSDDEAGDDLSPAFFERMVEAVGVAIYGADGRYRYVNRAYADLFDTGRDPLNSATMALGLAQQDCDSQHFGMIESALGRMETLIEDLLSLSRQGDVIDGTRQVRLDDVARAARGTAGSAGATLSIADDAPFQADRHRLQQAFEDLFGDAVEHGGEAVTVHVGTLPDGVYVEDDGPGLPEGHRESVFETGVTVDGGSGFGLAIVRRIVAAHGWDVRATAGTDGGARFEITGIEPGG